VFRAEHFVVSFFEPTFWTNDLTDTTTNAGSHDRDGGACHGGGSGFEIRPQSSAIAKPQALKRLYGMTFHTATS
jgi:hypothetical protein